MTQAAHDTDPVVSNEADALILVDADDRQIGSASKARCHDDAGLLHRAFSLFIFNGSGQLLLQQRSYDKRLWPGYWSNSCCSHPRLGESMDSAIQRRLQEEMGLRTALTFLYKFQYQARFGNLGSEHELCSVYYGISDEPVHCNRNEVAAWRFISAAELDRQMALQPEQLTPWFKLEWQCIKRDHPHIL